MEISSPTASARVSVVIPTRNRDDLLDEALASLVAQTMCEWEAIVIDDGSEKPVSESTLCSRFGSRVRVARHSVSRGGAAAKNTGISLASSSIIAFLDDDDLYACDYLSKALLVLDNFVHLDVLFMGVSWFGKASRWAEDAYTRAMATTLRAAKGTKLSDHLVSFDKELFSAMLRSVPMAFQRPIVRRGALSTIGGYREGCLLWDCDWAIRAAMHGRGALLEERLYRQRVDGQGISSRKNILLEHHLSRIEMTDWLLTHLKNQGKTEFVRQVDDAVTRARISLAYYHASIGEAGKALSAWRMGHRLKNGLNQYIVVLKLLLRAFLNGKLRRYSHQ